MDFILSCLIIFVKASIGGMIVSAFFGILILFTGFVSYALLGVGKD